MPTPDLGFGSFVKFGTTALVLKWRSIDGPSQERTIVDAPSMNTTTGYIPKLASDLINPGELSGTVLFGGDQNPLTALQSTGELISVYWGTTSGGPLWTGTGSMTAFSPSASGFEDVMEADVPIAVLGAISSTGTST